MREHRDEDRAAALAPVVPSPGDLIFYAQKIVRLQRLAEPCGYELLSWVRARDGGIRTLTEFASAGDRYRLLPLIDRHVVHRALEMLGPYGESLRRIGISVSLTVCGRSLADADFVRFLCAELSRSGVGSSVMIQISERIVPATLVGARDLLRAVCATGGRLVIDDVRAGPTGIYELADVPVARIRIDRALTDNLWTNPHAAEAIGAVVEHARRADIETLATFIPTVMIANELRALGVDCGQGSVFGEPEPLETMLRRLE